MTPLEISDPAEADYQAALAYYKNVDTRVADRFQQVVEDALGRMVEFPELYQTLRGHFRCATLRGFPYVIVYRYDGNSILVWSVADARRDPESWMP